MEYKKNAGLKNVFALKITKIKNSETNIEAFFTTLKSLNFIKIPSLPSAFFWFFLIKVFAIGNQ